MQQSGPPVAHVTRVHRTRIRHGETQRLGLDLRKAEQRRLEASPRWQPFRHEP